jgi:hypothetical protein
LDELINKRLLKTKLLAGIGLLAAAAVVTIRYGFGAAPLFLSVFALAILLWCFHWPSRPAGEQPTGAVSCCHYLGDREDR